MSKIEKEFALFDNESHHVFYESEDDINSEVDAAHTGDTLVLLLGQNITSKIQIQHLSSQ